MHVGNLTTSASPHFTGAQRWKQMSAAPWGAFVRTAGDTCSFHIGRSCTDGADRAAHLSLKQTKHRWSFLCLLMKII